MKYNLQQIGLFVFSIFILLTLIYGIIRHRFAWVRIPSVTQAHYNIENHQLIPKIIHQTHKSDKVPKNMGKALFSWIKTNPEYEHRYRPTHERHHGTNTTENTRGVQQIV